jgi:hypothetical protein
MPEDEFEEASEFRPVGLLQWSEELCLRVRYQCIEAFQVAATLVGE